MNTLADLRIETQDRVVIATISGEIDMSNATSLRDAVIPEIGNEMLGLVLDMSGVTYLDSAAIHMIFELRGQLATRGQHLRLVVPRGAAPLHALTLVGVPDAVPVVASAAEARDSIAGARSG